MSPRPTTSTRPQSSPTCSSWTRRRSSPTKSLLRTPTTMTLHSKTCSTKYKRAQAYHSLREDLSVSLSSSSVSDRLGRTVGDRSGRPGEHRNSEAQIRTLLDNQKEQILAECLNTNFKQLEPKKSNDSFKDNYCSKSCNFVKLIKEVLTEMEALRKFQSSAFDTIARRRLVEDQNTILELSGRIQDSGC